MSEKIKIEESTSLTIYDSACRALSEARTIDEVKDIRDRALALRLYAKQAKNKNLEADAFEIRVRAERRVGEMMSQQPKASGTRGQLVGPGIIGGFPENLPIDDPIPLAKAGIDKNLAHRARQFASVSDTEFTKIINIGRAQISDAADKVKRKTINELTQASIKSNKINLIDGIYDVIVIDPPWPMKKIDRDVRPNQVGFDYPTMDESELERFWIDNVHHTVAQDCHLFCWTTHKFFPMALRLIEKWGFRYVCTMVWHKPGGFQPIGLPQYNCEFVIYARHGSPTFADTKDFFTCFNAPRREHSRKPDEFYDLVRRVTYGNRIDVFSREARDGFDQLGNETEKF